MKALLEKYLLQSYAIDIIISVPCMSFSGNFGLSDSKSCMDCERNTYYFYNSCDRDRYVSLHKSECLVNVVRLEDVFQNACNIPEFKKGGCCDYLLYSDNKIAVMELTCGRPEYVGNKRAKAYRQIEDSIFKLRQSEIISHRIDSYDERLAVFSLKNKLFAVETNESDIVLSQMRSFSKMSDNQSPATDMGNGFVFQIQKYPEVQEW